MSRTHSSRDTGKGISTDCELETPLWDLGWVSASKSGLPLPLASPPLSPFFCPRSRLSFGEGDLLLPLGQGTASSLARRNCGRGALAHPSSETMPNAKDEEAQEKQTQTEEEGEAPPQPGLSAPGDPCPEHCFSPAPGESSPAPPGAFSSQGAAGWVSKGPYSSGRGA